MTETFTARTRRRAAAVSGAAALALCLLPTASAHADESSGGSSGNSSHAQKTRSAVVVLLNFQDSQVDSSPEAKEKLRNLYFGDKKSLNSYYQDVSRGVTSFQPADADKPVIGPVDVGTNATCDTDKMQKAATDAVTQQGMNPDKIDHVSMVFNNDKAGCGWGGLASVGGNISWLPEGVEETALSHEIGHNLGYAHQMRQRCTGGELGHCTEDGTSAKSPMGGGGVQAGLSAPELIQQKWLTPGELTKVKKSGSYPLQSLYGGSGSGKRALDIPLGKTDDHLVVEYRRASGKLDTKKQSQGVFAYRVSGDEYGNATLLDPTPKNTSDGGEKLTKKASLRDAKSKLKVSLSSAKGQTAKVNVSLDGKAVHNAPTPNAGAAQPHSSSAPKHEGTHVTPSAGAESADAPSGDKRATEHPSKRDENREDLAETGSDGLAMPLTAGAALVVAGGVAVGVSRKRRSAARR